MRRITLLTILLTSVVFLVPTYAGKPQPSPNQVEVVNTIDNPVPVTMDQATVTVVNDSSNPLPVDLGNAQVTIGNDQSNPVPVSVVDGCTKTIVSGQYGFTPSVASVTFIDDVPADSVFIVTDLIVSWNGGSVFRVDLLEDSSTKFSIQVLLAEGQYHPFSFNSGVSFASSSDVIISNPSGWNGNVFISGYLTSCF
jgi:hypothetical protein